MIHLCLAINPDLKTQMREEGRQQRQRADRQPGVTLADAGTGWRCALLCKAVGGSLGDVE